MAERRCPPTYMLVENMNNKFLFKVNTPSASSKEELLKKKQMPFMNAIFKYYIPNFFFKIIKK